MMPIGFPGGLPRVGTQIKAAFGLIFRDGQFTGWLSGGKILAGAYSRDPGNTPYLNVLRTGVILGKMTSGIGSGLYAPGIYGPTTGAIAAGATSIGLSAAVGAEIARRTALDSLNNLIIVGPPTANGIVQQETLTFSGTPGTTLTVTATQNAYVSGSLILPNDGSQDFVTVLPNQSGLNVFDTDNVTAINQPLADFPIAGTIIAANLLPVWPSDTSLQGYITSKLNEGGGKWIFDVSF